MEVYPKRMLHGSYLKRKSPDPYICNAARHPTSKSGTAILPWVPASYKSHIYIYTNIPGPHERYNANTGCEVSNHVQERLHGLRLGIVRALRQRAGWEA